MVAFYEIIIVLDVSHPEQLIKIIAFPPQHAFSCSRSLVIIHSFKPCVQQQGNTSDTKGTMIKYRVPMQSGKLLTLIILYMLGKSTYGKIFKVEI